MARLGAKTIGFSWHDIIKNCLKKHKPNGYEALHSKGLVEILENYFTVIEQQPPLSNIVSTLRQIGTPIIRFTKYLISKKKQRSVLFSLENSKKYTQCYFE